MGSRFFTRSRVAPEWSSEEMMSLVSHVGAVEDECGNDFSSHQKWEMISSNFNDVRRSAFECRRKWDALSTQHARIRQHQNHYWSLDSKQREDLGLPVSFDRDLFDLLDHAIVKTTDSRASDPEEDEEEVEEEYPRQLVLDVEGHGDSGTKKVSDMKGKIMSKNAVDQVMDMADHLQKNAEQIEAVLGGEISEDDREHGSLSALTELDESTNFRRRQADQMIEVFGILVGNLQKLNELLETVAPG